MIIHNIEQGTPEWHELRKGKLTGSNAQAISANGAGLKTYVKKIILGLFTEGKKLTGADIDRGNELEPIARAKYEFEKGVDVVEVGFIEMTNRLIGISPDGLVGEDGMIEIKARNNEIHYYLLMNGKIDSKTDWQMQMQMFVSRRKWCDFISYNPNFKKNSLFVKRVYLDQTKVAKLSKGLYEGEKMIKEALENPIIQDEIKALEHLQAK